MGEKHKPYSDRYQYEILELPYDFNSVAAHSRWNNEDGLYNISRSEIVKELDEQGFNRLQSIAQECLTKPKIQVFNLLYEGKTQNEIASITNHKQSSIARIISNDGISKGIYDILKDACLCDESFRVIIKQLEEHASGKFYFLTRRWFTSEEDFQDWLDTELDPILKIPVWQVDAGMIKKIKRRQPKTNLEIQTIIALFKSGKSCIEIAVLYGCTGPTVSKMLKANGIILKVGRPKL